MLLRRAAESCPALHYTTVVDKSGGQYDLIIDDGGHNVWEQRPSFEVLWDHLMPGGLYFIEDLQASNSEKGMIRVLLGWTDMLASTRHPGHRNWKLDQHEPISWVKWPSALPKDMISVHCQAEICVMRKNCTATKPAHPTHNRKSNSIGSSNNNNNNNNNENQRTSMGLQGGLTLRNAPKTFASLTASLFGQRAQPYWGVHQCPLLNYGKAFHDDNFNASIHTFSGINSTPIRTYSDRSPDYVILTLPWSKLTLTDPISNQPKQHNLY